MAERSSSPGVPIVFISTLFLLAASRWGSYLHVPGVPFYIGDALVLLAVGQAIVLWRKGSLPIRDLKGAPKTAILVAVFFCWAMVRVVTRTALPFVAVRDLAPYAYSVVALLTFLSPMRHAPRARVWIYSALALHLGWYLAATEGLVDTSSTWRIGSGTTLFSTRPDFDAAVCAIATAFALHQLVVGPRPARRGGALAIGAFAALNAYAVSAQHSRSGLLAGLIAVAAVLAAWLICSRKRSEPGGQSLWVKRVSIGVAALAIVAAAALFTLPGQRLIQGFAGSGEAGGKTNARVRVHEGLTSWIVESPVRAVVGIGYGPNVLARSKTVQHLAGEEFENVRSPHDYLLGTWARLGVIGAAMAAAIFLAAGCIGLQHLTRRTEPADVLAALIAVTIPVVAMFGVVLESPFGAIPYFWAVGQLCGTARRTARERDPDAVSGISAGAQAQGQLLDG